MFHPIQRGEGRSPFPNLEHALKNEQIEEAIKIIRLNFLSKDPSTGECLINKPNFEGRTLLHLAAECGRIRVVDYLLTLGADPKVTDNAGHTPLHSAVIEAPIPKVLELLGRIRDSLPRDRYGRTPLHDAARLGKVEVVKFYSDHKMVCGSDNRGHTPLFYAAENNHYEVVRLLFKDSSQVGATDERKMTLLHYFVMHGWGDLVATIIERGADVNALSLESKTPLHYTKDLKMTNLLLQHGAKIDPTDLYGDPACDLRIISFRDAIQGDFLFIIQAMIAKKFDLKDKKAELPLHLAVEYGRDRILLELHSHDRKLIKLKDSQKRTAYQVALDFGKTAIADRLKSLGAKIPKMKRNSS